jgi:hypothetical protein
MLLPPPLRNLALPEYFLFVDIHPPGRGWLSTVERYDLLIPDVVCLIAFM